MIRILWKESNGFQMVALRRTARSGEDWRSFGGRIREAERVGNDGAERRRLAEQSRRSDNNNEEALLATEEEDGARNRTRAIEAFEVISVTMESALAARNRAGMRTRQELQVCPHQRTATRSERSRPSSA